MKTIRFFSMLALMLPAITPLAVQAQPDPNNAPKAENPANRPPRGFGLGQPMTPEQMRTLLDQYLRPQLTAANVTDQKQQDAVLTFVSDELSARQKLSESARTLATAVRNPALSDAQIAGLLNEYVAAVQDDKARHQKATDALKAAITVSQFPRLEAALTLYGLWNDAPPLGGGLFGGGAGAGGGGRPINRRNPRQNQNGGARNPAPF